MGFESLLGNDQLRQRLTAATASKRLSHSYLIAGPEGAGKHTTAQLLAAAMQCTADTGAPCLQCAQCRKVLSNCHPDVITVDDQAHKIIAVKVIRQARQDVFIRPNEGKRKIYIIPRSQDLGPAGQNALLKVMEEPPDYAAFLLLSENPARLLATIRSRCVELRLSPLSKQILLSALHDRFPTASQQALSAAAARSGGFLGQAISLMQDTPLLPQTEPFANAFARQDALALLQLLAPMERLSRDQLLPVLRQWQALLHDALSASAGLPAGDDYSALIAANRAAADILAATRQLQTAIQYAEANVSTGHICGALCAALCHAS